MIVRFAVSLTLASLAVLASQPAVAADDVASTLQRFASDYALDPTLHQERTFGIRVDGDWWRVHAVPAAAGQPASVSLEAAAPASPTYYFTLDGATLGKVDRGELNALTAMGKARESDVAPMDMDVMEGFAPGPGFLTEILDTAFHFWTRGVPERIPFDASRTRTLHGAQATIFFYQPGFRSAWFQIRPGQHVNADPKDQSNPFPTLLVPTHGHAKARIGGVEVSLDAGEALLIPPNTAHEFWNPYDEPADGVLLMFGDGA